MLSSLQGLRPNPEMTGLRRSLRFVCKPHQGKERAYTKALLADGWRQVVYRRGWAHAALFDLTNGRGGVGWNENILGLHKVGVPLFLYPHAARPMIQWDGICDVWPHTRASFVIAEGHAEVMRRYGYPHKTVVTGWTFCKQKPFKPAAEVKTVVFGPIHPNANGWLNPVDIAINSETFRRLDAWRKRSGARLIVRHIHPLSAQGVPEVRGVEYIQATPDGSTREIDSADLVVGHQTFAYIAVARGVPTLMMAENEAPRSGNCDANFTRVKSWDLYRDYLAYPLDILAEDDTAGLIERAVKSDDEIAEWRERFIGKPFDPDFFVSELKRMIQ